MHVVTDPPKRNCEGERFGLIPWGFWLQNFDFDFDSSNGAARDPDCWKVAIGISVSTEETSSSFLQASSSSSPLHAQLLLLLPVFFLLVL